MLLAVQRNWLLKIPLSSPRCSVQFVWSCCSLGIFELCSDPLQKFCWEHFCWSRRKTNPDPCYFNKMSGDCVHTSGWHVPGRPLLCRWHPNNHPWAALGFGKHNLMVSLADASTNMSVWKFGHHIFAAPLFFYSRLNSLFLFSPTQSAAVEAASDRTSLIILTPQFVLLTRLMIHISHIGNGMRKWTRGKGCGEPHIV